MLINVIFGNVDCLTQYFNFGNERVTVNLKQYHSKSNQ